MVLFSSYLLLLVVAGGALTIVLAVVLLRSHWNQSPTRLDQLLNNKRSEDNRLHQEYLAPLLTYSARYRSFTEILGLVLEKFSLARILEKQEVRGSLRFLAEATCTASDPHCVRGAMCQIVRCFMEDPDIEYQCRPLLSPLIDEFLIEIEKADKSLPATG